MNAFQAMSRINEIRALPLSFALPTSTQHPNFQPFCHNGFPFDLKDKPKHGVATNLFCLGVIGHQKGLSFYKN